MKYHKQKYLNKLFNFALTNNCDDFHVFMDFSGHVESIRISVHLGRWKDDILPDFIGNFYLSDEEEFKTESILNELKELKRNNDK